MALINSGLLVLYIITTISAKSKTNITSELYDFQQGDCVTLTQQTGLSKKSRLFNNILAIVYIHACSVIIVTIKW